MRILLIVAPLLLLCGCAHRVAAPGNLNYTVDLVAAHGTMRMVNCNSDSPPKCEHTYVKYDKGSEQLDVSLKD